MTKMPPNGGAETQGSGAPGWGRVPFSASPSSKFDSWKSEMQLPTKVQRGNLVTPPFAPQFVMGMALIILGLDLQLYNAGEILASVVLSGIVVLLLGLACLSGFLIKEQEREFPPRSLRPRDFAVKHVHKLAVIGQISETVSGRFFPQLILERTLVGHILHDDAKSVQRALLTAYSASAEPDSQHRAVFPFPVGFDMIAPPSLKRALQQLRPLGGIQKDVAREIRSLEFLSGFIAEHGHKHLVDIQEAAILATAAHSVGRVFHQSPVMRLRMSQFFFGSISLFPQILFVENPPHGHGKARDAIHLDTILNAIPCELHGSFSPHGVRYEDERCSLIRLAQNFNRVQPLAVSARALGYNQVIALRACALRQFLHILCRVRSDHELHAVQLMQATFYGRYIMVNKQDSRRLPPAARFAGRSGTLLIKTCSRLCLSGHLNHKRVPCRRP